MFVVFALVSRQDKGTARAVSQTDGAPQKAVPNTRPKPSIPGTQGIAGCVAGGSSTHAKHVGAPSPYACPVITNVKGPVFIRACYSDIVLHGRIANGCHGQMGKVLDALMRISMVDITVAFFVASPNLALKAIDYFVDLRIRYTSAKTKVDAKKKQVLREREEKADALNEFCHGLDEICNGDGTSSDEDDERETFIVDDED